MKGTSTRTRWALKAFLPVLVLLAALAYAGAAGAATMTSSGTTAPWIQSDLADYAPGSTVHLYGGNWQPGETVTIFTNDTIGNSWSQTDTLTADDNGGISDDVTLPNYFVSNYDVTATGATSGTATTTFTDGNVSSLSGTVTDSGTGNPISGATLTCGATSGCNATITTTTDGSGNYTFAGAKKLSFAGNGPATLTLTVRMSGYTDGTITLTNVSNGDSFTGKNIALAPSVQNQTITVTTHAPSSATYNSQFTVDATASSGLGVSYMSSGACTNSGATYTMTSGTGTCRVKYDQAGNGSYNPAPQVTEDVTAVKADQVITLSAVPDSKVYNGTFTPSAVADSGLGVTVSVSGVCSRDSGTGEVTMTSGTGTCTVAANQAGDGNYNAAPEKSKDVTAVKADQVITLSAVPDSKVYNGTFTPSAVADSGLGVTVSVSGVCSRDSGTGEVTMTSGTGTCTVAANQAGDGNYNAAPEKSKDVTAVKADQVIRLSAVPDSKVYNGTFTPSAVADSGLGVTVSVSGVCSRDSGTGEVTMTSGTGTCTVAANQAGDGNYNAAPEKSKDVTAVKADQVIRLSAVPDSKVYNGTFTPSAVADSGLGVTVSVSGVCSRDSGTGEVTMTSGTGTCTVAANQAGDGNYNAAPEKSKDVTAVKADQAINFTSTAPPSAILGSTYEPTATGGGSGNPVTFAVSGGCTYDGATRLVTMTSVLMSCVVKADQAGNDDYAAATEATQTINVIYSWTGFFQPLNPSPDTCNSVKAGSAVPVKFSLGGYQGMNVIKSGYPQVAAGSCSGPLDPIDGIETVTAGNSSLSYDATTDQYVYVWKTDKTWTGAKRLTIVLADGTTRYARFSFTK